MNLLLRNLRWHSAGRDRHGDLRLRRGRIAGAGRGLAPGRYERTVDASGLLALPGLINAHDHLDLDLFPHLGEPPYASFYDWVEDVYRPEAPPIRDVLRVGLRDRLWWGAYRNLVAGVTTVVHHDPYYWWVFGRQLLGRRLVERRLFGLPYPVRVLRRYGWCHSLGGAELGYGDDPRRAYRRARGRPFIVHAAEGTDARAHGEVDRLDELGLLGPNTVLVHTIALSASQRARLAETGTSVVWCPASNLRLYGRTAPVGELRGAVDVVLGTDSTLTGSPTLLDELRAAAETGLAGPQELFEMVTTRASRVFELGDGRGALEPGAPADLVLLPDGGDSAAATLLAATPADVALVLVGGAPRLADEERAGALELGDADACMAGKPKWLHGDFPGLRRRIEEIAGRDLLARNPLESMLAAASS